MSQQESEQFIENLQNMTSEEVVANFKSLFEQALAIEEQETKEYPEAQEKTT